MAVVDRGHKSRKFIVTMYAMSTGAGITVLSMYAKPDPGFYTALGGLYILLAAGISSYNWANLREGQNGSAPGMQNYLQEGSNEKWRG